MTDRAAFTADTDPVLVIQQEARAVAQSFGVAVPDEAAAALVERLLLRLGGSKVYVPKLNRRAAHSVIRERFDGSNLKQLAREHGLSVRHVRRILGMK